MITRIALYSTLGLVLNALGQQWDSWGFWATVALFWASEHLTRRELLEEIQQQVAALRAAGKDKDNTQ